jgi:dolichol-phosphate mannosyltransferase
MSALQLLSLGIVGEYVRRIFLEVKGRPAYIVRDAPVDEPTVRSKGVA